MCDVNGLFVYNERRCVELRDVMKKVLRKKEAETIFEEIKAIVVNGPQIYKSASQQDYKTTSRDTSM